MNRFNLTFSGEIQPGHDPELVKLRFANLFGIDDPVRLNRFFCGETFTLRRNLERKEAANYYHELQLLGVVAALVKTTTSEVADEILKATPPKKTDLDRTTAFTRSASHVALPQDSADIAAKIKARKLAAEKAQRKAEDAARRQAEFDEKKRQAAEAEAQRAAELEEQKRLAAEDEARRQAELEKKTRQAAQKETRRNAEIDKKRRIAAEKAARIAAAKEENARQSTARRRVAAEKLAAQQEAGKAAKPRVKTTMEVPLRARGQAPQIGVPGQRKRQSGKPNLYKLRPFRNSQEVRERAAHARQRMRQSYTVGILALAVLLIAGGSFLQRAASPMITGASAIAINSNFEPLLLAGDRLLFHDRAGVSTTEVPLSALGVDTLSAPLLFDADDRLIARGRLSDSNADPAQVHTLQILRCDLALSVCLPFSAQLQGSSVDTFVLNPVDGSLLLADGTAGQLMKVDSEGKIVASAAVAIPVDPVLRLHGGLLLVNSAEGPAISVFRYEDDTFGRQLDEVLLLPPGEQQLEPSTVGDFVWSGDAWWVNLLDPESGRSKLHRFNEDWKYLGTVSPVTDSSPLQLVKWGQKTLANDSYHPAIDRYNAQGAAEVPFVSTRLQALISAGQQHNKLTSTAWHSALLVSALAAALGFAYGYLQGLRGLVYNPRREQGAEPLDDYAAALHWIEPVQNRLAQLRRTGIYYGVGVLCALLLAITLNISAWQLAALLLTLSGPAVALLLLGRQPVGHIGVLGDRLLLVDHSGMYHLAGGPRLQYRGPFLLIDDIVVFCGSGLLPAFSPNKVQQLISPPALGAIKVDYKTVVVKLLECRHPLALGAIAIMAGLAAASSLLTLRSIF